MISAREDIANGTKESISEWGFNIRIVYKSTGDIADKVPANGRKTSMTTNSDGLPIVLNKPYLSIVKEDLDIIPVKGDLIRTPKDFFRPVAGQTKWYRVESVPLTDDDWFVKVYLTETKNIEATE